MALPKVRNLTLDKASVSLTACPVIGKVSTVQLRIRAHTDSEPLKEAVAEVGEL